MQTLVVPTKKILLSFSMTQVQDTYTIWTRQYNEFYKDTKHSSLSLWEGHITYFALFDWVVFNSSA